MELKLNVYNKDKVEKTYIAESYNIMFGTVEDLINAIDFDKLKTGKDGKLVDDELIKAVAGAVPKIFGMIKPLLKDVFPGLTDEEIKKVRFLEVAKVIVNIIKFTAAQVMEGATGKN